MAIKRETIELVNGNWWFCQRGVYDRSSVLAGQDFRQLVRCFGEGDEGLQDAKSEHPKAEVSWEGKPQTYIPVNPPAWFDPMDAGERWDEDY